MAPQAREAARACDDAAAARSRPPGPQRSRLRRRVHARERGAAAGARCQAREAVRAAHGHAHDLPHAIGFWTGMTPVRVSGAAGRSDPDGAPRVRNAVVSEQPSSARAVLASRPRSPAAVLAARAGPRRLPSARKACSGAAVYAARSPVVAVGPHRPCWYGPGLTREDGTDQACGERIDLQARLPRRRRVRHARPGLLPASASGRTAAWCRLLSLRSAAPRRRDDPAPGCSRVPAAQERTKSQPCYQMLTGAALCMATNALTLLTCKRPKP